jgi:hypothetical protein
MSTNIPMPVFGALSTSWWQVTRDVSDTLSAANKVVGYRTALMAMAGPVPSAHARLEFGLMSREKIEAASESIQAMGKSFMTLSMDLAMETSRQLWAASAATIALSSSGTTAQWLQHQAALLKVATQSPPVPLQLFGSAAHLVQQGLAPIRDRATANAERLSAL